MSPKPTIRRLLIATASVLACLLPIDPVDAEDPYVPPLATLANGVRMDFPNAVEFHLMYAGVADPHSVDLEFSVDPVHSCDGGTVHSKRFPAATTIIWRWEPSGDQVLPPGHTVRWRWKVTGADGSVRVSHPRKFVWADERFEWQSYTKDELTVHWYDQYPELGEHLVGFLEPQLERIEPIETSRNPVNVYIYGNEQDAGPGALLQRDTVNSYRAFNTVVSVMPEEIEGDELTALIHELAHFLVQDRAFNCFNGLPQWLEEGLAMLAEGGLSNEMRRAFAEARLIEQFIPLRSFDTPIASSASERTAQYLESHEALIRYAQSYSLVEVFKDEFGWLSIGFLLDLFKYGVTVDDALKLAFGINTEETELLWRFRSGMPVLAPNRVSTTPSDGGG